MTQKQIQVGIVGASAQKSWAHLLLVPAILEPLAEKSSRCLRMWGCSTSSRYLNRFAPTLPRLAAILTP